MGTIICVDLRSSNGRFPDGEIYAFENGENWRFLERLSEEPLSADTVSVIRNAEYSLAVISGERFLTTRLNLPFSDRKQISQILISELTDIVPAQLEKFYPVILSVTPDLRTEEGAVKSYSVEVLLALKEELENVLGSLKQVGIDPAYLLTPGNSFRALLPEDFEKGFSLIKHRDICYLREMKEDGSFGLLRIITRPRTNRTIEEEGLMQAFALLSSAEEEEAAQTLYVSGIKDREALHSILEKSEGIKIVELDESVPPAVEVARYLVKYGRANSRLENLRTGPYSYALRLSDIATGLQGIGPYFYSFLACLLLCFGAIFFIHNQSAADIQSALNQKVANALGRDVEEGRELEVLKQQNALLEKELSQIGNFSKNTPLDQWLEVTRVIPSIPGVEFKSVKIRGNKLTLEGSAPDYTAIDRIEKALRKKRGDTICRFSQQNLGGSAQKNGMGFMLDIRFCE